MVAVGCSANPYHASKSG